MEQPPVAVLKSRSLSQLAQQGGDDGRTGDDARKKEKDQKQKKVDIISQINKTTNQDGTTCRYTDSKC